MQDWSVPHGAATFNGGKGMRFTVTLTHKYIFSIFAALLLLGCVLFGVSIHFMGNALYASIEQSVMRLQRMVDTYNTLKSGVPNAIKAFKNILLPQGITDFAIRLDSGDISYLSKKARRMLDEAGLSCCRITASNALDEYLIRDLMMQGAEIDTFGVGERLITAKSSPVFGGVYKLCAVEQPDGRIVPKINLSENVHKITIPSSKNVYRLFDMDSGKAIADVLTTDSEELDDSKPYELFDPDYTWKRKEIENYVARPLLVQIFKKGECVYNSPTPAEIREYCSEQVDTLWDEVKRFENPHKYYVDLSAKLWEIRKLLIEEYKGVRK